MILVSELRKIAREKLAVLSGESGINQVPQETLFLETDILLSYSLGLTREQLVTRSTLEVSEENQRKFFELINRRLNHEPIAYIIGEKEFYGLSFSVNKRVLIPRPETEQLVESGLSELKDQKEKFTLIDIGTGSGAIIVALCVHLKKILPENLLLDSKIIALDISDEALEVARINAEKNGVENLIEFRKSSFLSALSNDDFLGKILILSNPPYISNSEELPICVDKFEPELALRSGDLGSDAFEEILSQILKKNKKIKALIEIGFAQVNDIESRLVSAGVSQRRFINDLSGRRRFVEFSV